VSSRPAASPDLTFERDRLGGTLARILDLAKAGRTSGELHERYHVTYAVSLTDGLLAVTVWAEPEDDTTPSRVAGAVERVGGVVLQGTGGVVRARLTLDQVGALSGEPEVRILRLVRHHEPIP
jgi:hypothetical protein